MLRSYSVQGFQGVDVDIPEGKVRFMIRSTGSISPEFIHTVSNYTRGLVDAFRVCSEHLNIKEVEAVAIKLATQCRSVTSVASIEVRLKINDTEACITYSTGTPMEQQVIRLNGNVLNKDQTVKSALLDYFSREVDVSWIVKTEYT